MISEKVANLVNRLAEEALYRHQLEEINEKLQDVNQRIRDAKKTFDNEVDHVTPVRCFRVGGSVLVVAYCEDRGTISYDLVPMEE
jgi:hypothetical protein